MSPIVSRSSSAIRDHLIGHHSNETRRHRAKKEIEIKNAKQRPKDGKTQGNPCQRKGDGKTQQQHTAGRYKH